MDKNRFVVWIKEEETVNTVDYVQALQGVKKIAKKTYRLKIENI